MAKTKAAKRKSNSNWTGADHSDRTAKRIASLQKKQRKQQQKLLAKQETDNADINDAVKQQPKVKTSKRPRLSSQVPHNTYKRTHLAHDNQHTIEMSKLRLATSQIQRQVDFLHQRLESWDPSDPTNDFIIKEDDNGQVVVTGDVREIEQRMEVDALNRRMDEEAREKAKGEQILIEAQRGVNSSLGRRKANLRKKPRPGPETWKLRGAARPAWQVYDFDTRYVDPHIKALEDHKERMKRSINVFTLCRGRFAMDYPPTSTTNNTNNTTNSNNKQDDSELFIPPQPHCRTYLSLLTQLGSLHLTRKNYASARSSFLSVLELEGYHHPSSITNARNQLMNMYLSTNRPFAARQLWNMLPNDTSAWIRYSAALMEYVSWNLLGENGSSQINAEKTLADAIEGNVYVVYALGWKDVFDRAMEYTVDVVEWGDGGESGSIMEAVEYYGCGCLEDEEEMERGLAVWLGTDGSLDWVRSFVLRVLTDEDYGRQYKDVRSVLLGWETRLAKEEEVYEKEKESTKEMSESGDIMESGDNKEEEEEPDLLMYAGMFRTAMDWLQDAGEFKKSPTDNYIVTVANDDRKETKPDAQMILDQRSDSESDGDSGDSSEEE